MELLNLRQFQQLTRATDSQLLSILRDGSLPLSLGTHGEILVDISALTADKLACLGLIRSAKDKLEDELLLESVAAEILSVLDEYMGEAFELACKWLAQKQESRSEGEG